MNFHFWVKDFLSRRAVGPVGKTALAPLLVLSKAYGEIQTARRWAYRVGLKKSYRPRVPVISIGNITVGGTGKTPCVEAVCRIILKAGKKPAILTRGYGGKFKGNYAIVSDGDKILLTPSEAGDEPVLLANALPGVPVLVGADRKTTAKLAVEKFGVGALLLDDGFQHLRLARDLDIITMDATNPFANGHCLPRGFLREKLQALTAANLILLTHADKIDDGKIEILKKKIQKLSGQTPILKTRHKPTGCIDVKTGETKGLQALKELKVLAFAGIGNPEIFFQSLKELGATVLQSEPFPDHHVYKQHEIKKLDDWADLMNADALTTTEKDRARLTSFPPTAKPILSLCMELDIMEQGDLFDEIIQKIIGC